MSDIRCVVCGEPWDSYGVNHGDMLAWEARLFRAGQGCPCCEGQAPEHAPRFETLSDFENGDECELARIEQRAAVEAGKPRAEWKSPDPVLLWECDGCGLQVVRDESECWLDGREVKGDSLAYHAPPKSQARQWYGSHPYTSRSADPTEAPAATIGESKICEFCLSHCAHCGAEVSTQIQGDTYDPGWCASHEAHGFNEVFCIECHESGELDETDDETEDAEEDDDETEDLGASDV